MHVDEGLRRSVEHSDERAGALHEIREGFLVLRSVDPARLGPRPTTGGRIAPLVGPNVYVDPLLGLLLHVDSTVLIDRLSGDISRVFTCEEGDKTRNLSWLRNAAGRDVGHDPLFISLERGPRHVRPRVAG